MVAFSTRGERREGKETYHHFPHSIPIMHTSVTFKFISDF